MLKNVVAVALALAATAAQAQDPIPPTAVLPDPASIPVLLPSDLKWTDKGGGQWQAPLFGDPSKPGTYAILIRWLPGGMSRPHKHSTDRWAYVLSGTWWVSSSAHFDPATTYPVKAGTFATHIANKVHWDGAKDEEALVMVIGTGPMTTTPVPDEGPKR